MEYDRIEREVVIAAPPARVWAALAAPEYWLGEGDPAGYDFREGGRMVSVVSGYGSFPAVIETIEPERYLAYRWANRFAPDEPATGNSTLVEFTLTAEGDKTRLRVVESGFAGFAVAEAERRQAADDNLGGWGVVLDELREKIETSEE